MLHEIKVYFDSTRQARFGFRWTAKCVSPMCACLWREADGATAEQAQARLAEKLIEWQDERRAMKKKR